jgi:PAS domain S-box-containing protein
MNSSAIIEPRAAEAPDAAVLPHLVQFYEGDPVLIEAIGKYLRDGLEAGSAAIVIATAEHEAQLAAHWAGQGFDARAARERGQLVTLDAAQTLARLLVDGWPHAGRFEETIGSLIAESNRRFGKVVAFGEMVGLLWAQGRADAAIGLEALWNALATRHEFSLYCAYRLRDCARGDSELFGKVCDAHSHVIPGESFAVPPGEPQRARIVAQLQLKTAALEREIELRKRIESMLADRERELSDLVENAVYAIHKVGPDGTILWANPAELALLGYESAEYVGRNIADFHADRDAIGRVLDRLAAGETIRDHPARLRCKDGSIRHVLISSNALIEHGRLVSTRCFTRDVSDRWLAQEALRERGAVLHLAMQGARMGYWVCDLARDSIRCSHELAALFGLSGARDLPLDAFLALIHPEDRHVFRESLQQSIDSRSVFLHEFRVRTDMADWRWFEGRGEAVYDESLTPSRFYGVCMDVTKRKRGDQMLAHLAAVVDSAEDAIVSKTLDGIVTSWNTGAARIFGYEASEMIGRPLTTIIPPELHYEEAMILGKVKAGERIEHYRTTRRAKDGTLKQVSLAVSPVRDASGRIVGASKIAREVKT